ILEKIELTKGADKRVYTYSGGMRKRLEIGTALFPSIKIFILDEPTTGVDPLGRRDFLGILNDLRKEGITVLMTTHIGADAEAASKVGLMDKGRIIAEGESEELKNKVGLQNVVNVETSIKSKKVSDILSASTRAKCHLKLRQDTESTQIRQRNLLLK
ncbi:MAG: ATP-binding cassette domain-containing protein, partial [Nitrososphaerales archaeon]